MVIPPRCKRDVYNRPSFPVLTFMVFCFSPLLLPPPSPPLFPTLLLLLLLLLLSSKKRPKSAFAKISPTVGLLRLSSSSSICSFSTGTLCSFALRLVKVQILPSLSTLYDSLAASGDHKVISMKSSVVLEARFPGSSFAFSSSSFICSPTVFKFLSICLLLF